MEAACVSILVVFLWLRPYKETDDQGETNYSWINVSDAVLLTNLTLVAIFSSTLDESPKSHAGVKGFVNFLAYVPLMVLVFVLYRSADQYYRKKKRGDETKYQFIVRRLRHGKRFQYGADRLDQTEASATSDINAATAGTTMNRLSAPEY